MRTPLLCLGRESHFRPGDFLLREGDQSDHVLLLIRGRVKVTSAADNGYAAVFGIRGPGDLLGEMACLNKCARSATVSALDPVVARNIPGTQFLDFVGRHPEAGVALAELISCRLRAANRRRLEFGAYPVRRRLALVLMDLDQWHGISVGDTNRRDVNLALSQADLAGLAGSSLESAAKAFRELARRGIVRMRRNRGVTILDIAALREVAEQ